MVLSLDIADSRLSEPKLSKIHDTRRSHLEGKLSGTCVQDVCSADSAVHKDPPNYFDDSPQARPSCEDDWKGGASFYLDFWHPGPTMKQGPAALQKEEPGTCYMLHYLKPFASLMQNVEGFCRTGRGSQAECHISLHHIERLEVLGAEA